MPPFKSFVASGRYCVICVCLLFAMATLPSELHSQQKITMRETYRTGDQYLVDTQTEQTGVLDTVADARQANMPKRLAKTGRASSQYVERVLSVDAEQQGNKTLRKYLILEAEQKIGNDSTQAKIRNGLQHVVLDRQGNQAVTFSPDGPMLLGELEQTRTDIFLPRLSGLFPKQPVSPGETWRASQDAIRELTDLQTVEQGSLECTFSSMEGAETALIKFFGQVTGTTPMGANQQTIQGSFRFDIKVQRLLAIQFEVTSILLDRERKRAGDVTARYQLTRKPAGELKVDLPDKSLDASEENTLLLVQEPRLGLELVHSRRWVPRPVSDKSWIIDGPSGSGLTIQFEPAASIPPAEAIRKQIESTLGKSVQSLKPLPDPAGWADVQRLNWMGMQNGKEFVFEYFLWKQGRHGAIIAGRYFAPEAGLAQKDVERMVRGLRVGPK